MIVQIKAIWALKIIITFTELQSESFEIMYCYCRQNFGFVQILTFFVRVHVTMYLNVIPVTILIWQMVGYV